MTVPGDVLHAGDSAESQASLYAEIAAQTETQIQSLTEALKELRKREGCYRTGASGERISARAVQQVLVDLGSSDWHLLADRRWPGTRRANIDLLLVGPPGVIVLDVKTWRDVRIEHGTLWHGQADAQEDVEKVMTQADAVASVLAPLGLAPTAVRPWLVLANRKSTGSDVGGVTVVGDQSLQRELVRLGCRLDAEQIAAVVAHLDSECPSATAPSRKVRSAPPAAEPTPRPHDETPTLLDVDEVFDAALEAALRGPIENWMVWLHPSQTQITTRSYSGPARVRGPAGTGKTVVALHRASHLTRRPGARILFTSFVGTLPHVHAALFERLAPTRSTHVEFRGVHSWSMRLLNSRGRQPNVTAGRDLFHEAWRAVGRRSDLKGTGLPEGYWHDEVSAVIKARGLTSVEQYLRLERVGRKTPLRDEQRRAVWALYEDYQVRLETSGQCDWDDVLRMALDSVRDQPVTPAYTAVIVDEVQDLNCLGLKLMYELVGDASDGLFLVGDGQQSVYPGGFTLSEAGVSITGRSVVLNRNYRNAAEVLSRALTIVEEDEYNDLETSIEPGHRSIEVDRPGGQVAEVTCADAYSQGVAMVKAIRWTIDHGTCPGDMAVLVSSNKAATAWIQTLADVGLNTCSLTDYAGDTSDAIKVGTYQRAKGLEFAAVFIPDYNRAVAPRVEKESEESFRDRSELQRRQLFVAMTRARDRLWLGQVTPTLPA